MRGTKTRTSYPPIFPTTSRLSPPDGIKRVRQTFNARHTRSHSMSRTSITFQSLETIKFSDMLSKCFPALFRPSRCQNKTSNFSNMYHYPIVCTVYVSKYTRHVDPIRVTICICYPTGTIQETDFPPTRSFQGRPMPKRDFCVMVTWLMASRYAWMPSVQQKQKTFPSHPWCFYPWFSKVYLENSTFFIILWCIITPYISHQIVWLCDSVIMASS